MNRSGRIIFKGRDWQAIKAELQARIAVEDKRQDICIASPHYTPGISREAKQ